MKKLVGLLGLLVIIVACLPAESATTPADRVSFFLEPAMGKGLGQISYDLFFLVSPSEAGSSRLEFPQSQVEAGGILGLSIEHRGRRTLLLEAGFSHSIIAIPGSMYDYDWIQPFGYPRIPFSYTYSADSTVNWSLSVEAAWSVYHAGPFDLSLYGTYQYQNISHGENGYTGWQWDPSTFPTVTTVALVSSAQPDVLEYTLSAHLPGLGLLGNVQVLPGLSLEMRAAYVRVYVSDRDDHRLRTKLSTSAGWGNGVCADLRAIYRLPAVPGWFTPYLILDGQVLYYVVTTLQTQYWYGNGDLNVPQGTLIAGVGHIITSDQFQVSIRLGFSL